MILRRFLTYALAMSSLDSISELLSISFRLSQLARFSLFMGAR